MMKPVPWFPMSLQLTEKLFHCNDALHPPGVFVEFQSVRCYDRKVQGTFAFCLFHESAELVAKGLVVGGIDGEVVLAEFRCKGTKNPISRKITGGYFARNGTESTLGAE